MSRRLQTPVIVIDALGVIAVALCAIGCFWLVAVWGDDTAQETRELRALVEASRGDLAYAEAANATQRELLALRETELAATGHLPVDTPTEAYFRTLSMFADACDLRVVRHQPVQARVYPGLLEQRYAYEVTGATRGILRFLQAVEQADFWADISYLKLDAHGTAGKSNANDRSAMLTFSLFSSLPTDDSAQKG